MTAARTLWRTLGLVFGLLVAFIQFDAHLATAHSDLVSADPAPNSIIEKLPDRVTLDFSTSILQIEGSAGANQLLVTSSASTRIDDGKVVIDGAQVSVAIDSDAPDSVYQVAYRVVSSDGHPIEGSYSFTAGQPSPEVTPSGTTETGTARHFDFTIVYLVGVGFLTAIALILIYRKRK